MEWRTGGGVLGRRGDRSCTRSIGIGTSLIPPIVWFSLHGMEEEKKRKETDEVTGGRLLFCVGWRIYHEISFIPGYTTQKHGSWITQNKHIIPLYIYIIFFYLIHSLSQLRLITSKTVYLSVRRFRVWKFHICLKTRRKKGGVTFSRPLSFPGVSCTLYTCIITTPHHSRYKG